MRLNKANRETCGIKETSKIKNYSLFINFNMKEKKTACDNIK